MGGRTKERGELVHLTLDKVSVRGEGNNNNIEVWKLTVSRKLLGWPEGFSLQKYFSFYFYLSEISVCACACAVLVGLVPMEAKRGHQIP